MSRGFQHDRLTEAGDETVEAVRSNLFACPCGWGTWLSAKTGYIYIGHGGNEREQWSLQKEGPWVRMDDEQIRAKLTDELERKSQRAQARAEAVIDGVRQLLEEHG